MKRGRGNEDWESRAHFFKQHFYPAACIYDQTRHFAVIYEVCHVHNPEPRPEKRQPGASSDRSWSAGSRFSAHCSTINVQPSSGTSSRPQFFTLATAVIHVSATPRIRGITRYLPERPQPTSCPINMPDLSHWLTGSSVHELQRLHRAREIWHITSLGTRMAMYAQNDQ
jgi:hypothetical protein